MDERRLFVLSRHDTVVDERGAAANLVFDKVKALSFWFWFWFWLLVLILALALALVLVLVLVLVCRDPM